MCDNFVTFNSTDPVVTMTGTWQDADSHVFTVGAMNNNTKKATEFIEGIMHQVELFAWPLTLSQIHDQATCKDSLITFSPFPIDKCQAYCILCKVNMIPKCIQQIEESLIAWYDFAPPELTWWQQSLRDIGPWG